MRQATLIGKQRENLGTGASGRLRRQGLIPCVITRKEGNVNFYGFINDFKSLVFTPHSYIVNIDVEGTKYKTIIQETQFNPLSDEVTHVDFLEVNDETPVKVELPIQLVGTSKGVQAGGKVSSLIRRLKVKGYINKLPDFIEVNISHLDLGKSVKVKEVNYEEFEILNSGNLPIATIEIPRALRSAKA